MFSLSTDLARESLGTIQSYSGSKTMVMRGVSKFVQSTRGNPNWRTPFGAKVKRQGSSKWAQRRPVGLDVREAIIGSKTAK
ncbi:hypothetical protein [Dubosiella muris]|uniref:Uncharacterized protein n=1 Tax=Dubosiella muris TaxID=3038133 RepID=A0AC61R4U1_9FIRM|nr:hypothetical protein [Dubosiella muris]TGY64871.1 hypothetical protein E5336_11360 [Dubosiella muris]